MGKAPLPLSRARLLFSPLIEQLERSPSLEVPISVHGKVQAYLISAERFAELNLGEPENRYQAGGPPRIRGTMKLVGDIDAALETAKREHLRQLFAQFEDQT